MTSQGLPYWLSFGVAFTSIRFVVSLALRELTKRFGSVVAVDRANLTVNSGEFLVIVGESGCGKTTTLRLIAGLEAPDSGTIFIGGVPVNDVPVGKRGLKRVFFSGARRNFPVVSNSGLLWAERWPLRLGSC